jgi:hypothetical protein
MKNSFDYLLLSVITGPLPSAETKLKVHTARNRVTKSVARLKRAIAEK